VTPQDARHDPGTPGNCVPALFHQLPRGGHPRRCVALCDEAGVNSVTLCRLPTYGSRAEPSKVANVTLECLFHDYAGLRRDIRPAGSVIPVAVNPVRPSLPLPLHAGHCDDIPMLLECAGTRRRHDCHCAVYGPPRHRHPRIGPRTANRRPTTTPPPSKPLLYKHRTHHNAPAGGGIARTAVSSVALLAVDGENPST
jgi:hypothetical protein